MHPRAELVAKARLDLVRRVLPLPTSIPDEQLLSSGISRLLSFDQKTYIRELDTWIEDHGLTTGEALLLLLEKLTGYANSIISKERSENS